jgi:hypothetical protein
MNAQEVLDNLDARCYEWFEPTVDPLDTYFRVADMRMTVFRSAQQWVIVFERLHYNVGTDAYEISLNAYSNCLQETFEGGMDLNYHLYPYYQHPFEFNVDATLVNPETDSWILDRNRFVICLNGERLEFMPTPEEYSAAGITFDGEIEGPDTIQPEHLLRFLCWRLNNSFFNSEDYLRSIIDTFAVQPSEPVFRQTGLSHHLSLFLQTCKWQHTDFEECPSEVPGFRVLARAIASGDLTEWNAQDPATFNTDWRPWEDIRIAERAQLRERVANGYSNGEYFVATRVEITETLDDAAEEL